MKKKNGNLLMAATLLLAVGVFFTSCRDHDEELMMEWYDDVRDAALGDVVAALQSDESALSDLIDQKIQDAINESEQCQCDIDALVDRIESLENELANLPSQPGQNGQDGITPQLKIEDGYWYVSYDNGATWVQLGKATGEGDQPGQNGQDGITPQLKIEDGYWYVSYDNGATWVQLGKATGEGGQNGQDADYDVVAQMIADSIAVLQQELNNKLEELAENFATIEQLNEVKDELSTLRLEFIDHVDAFLELEDYVTYAIANLEAADKDFADSLNVVKTTLLEVKAAAYAADALSKHNALRIDTLFTLLENYNVVDTAAIWTEVRATKEELVVIREEAQANLAEAKEYADTVAAAVKGELLTKVGELETALQEAEARLQTQIDDLKARVEALEEDVKALDERLTDVEEYLEKQITSVALHGAYSPVVGYFNLPNGTKSNILAAYYGTLAEGNAVTFPTADYTDMGVEFDYAAFSALGFDKVAETVEENAYGVIVAPGANAGKVYMTINPAEVAVTADQFSLVNSLGQESPAKILDVKPTADKLAFGYTRAGAVPVYEATARIENVADAKLRVELSDLKDALVDVVKFTDGVDLTDVVTTLYELVNNVADAHAIQATWEDAEGEAHTVYSDFSLATVAIKPLSYNFLADLNIQNVPGYHKGMSLVNKVFDKVGTINIPDLGISNLELPAIGEIKIEAQEGDSIEFPISFSTTIPYTFETAVKVEADIPDSIHLATESIKIEGTDDNGNPTVITGNIESHWIHLDSVAHVVVGDNGYIRIKEELVIPVDITTTVKVPSKVLLDEMSGSFDNVNDMLAGLGEFLDQVNIILADVNGKIEAVEDNLNAALDKIENILPKALNKVNKGACKLINSFNNILQPTMLVNTTDGFSMLSSIKGAPTTIDKASAVLVPTSFSAEILAPACKKFVAVTKAYDANGKEDLDAAKAANTGDLAKVLTGGTRAVQFNGKAGYTYEITYSACDFSGMISNSKYYVRVK